MPADAAVEKIIGNDLNLVLPKAQDTLEVAVVQAMDVLSGQTTPGAARNKILDALNQPPGLPTVPTGGAHGLFFRWPPSKRSTSPPRWRFRPAKRYC